MSVLLIRFLISLKNCSRLKKEFLTFKYSRQLLQIVICLYNEGLIQSYRIMNGRYFYIGLRYFYDNPLLQNIKIISKPSRFRFLKLKHLLALNLPDRVLILSTTTGILSIRKCKESFVGGKALFLC
jgi:ribosomal protein S8